MILRSMKVGREQGESEERIKMLQVSVGLGLFTCMVHVSTCIFPGPISHLP